VGIETILDVATVTETGATIVRVMVAGAVAGDATGGSPWRAGVPQASKNLGGTQRRTTRSQSF
jgi:hypothetical protein